MDTNTFQSSKQYDYLVVPCAGSPMVDNDGKVKFEDLEKDKNREDMKLFLGAEERMKAAFLLAKQAKRVVLIGGSRTKVLAMFSSFKDRISTAKNFGDESYNAIELITIVSDADSTGNLSAFKKYINSNLDTHEFKIGVISNDYHLHRLQVIWKGLFGDYPADFIEAENVLGSNISKSMYEKEYKNRLYREEMGIRDWNNKQYRKQEYIDNWNPGEWTCEVIEFKIKNI